MFRESRKYENRVSSYMMLPPSLYEKEMEERGDEWRLNVWLTTMGSYGRSERH